MSELTEDAYGDALLALCERGASMSDIANPGGWVRVVARRTEVQAVRRTVRRRKAERRFTGLDPECVLPRTNARYAALRSQPDQRSAKRLAPDERRERVLASKRKWWAANRGKSA